MFRRGVEIINPYLKVYIALVVTLLAILVVPQLGENQHQNRVLAEQASALARTNYVAASRGCHRGNYVRAKINVVANGLSELIEKQVESAEATGVVLTPAQRAFVRREYRRLRPLGFVNCQRQYPKPKALR
jgi:hypothetical protein